MKRLILFLIIMIPASSFAQAEPEDIAPLFLEGANFFVCVIAGLLLAIAFQLLLTMLSVAGGITAIGDISKKSNSSHSHSHSHSGHHNDEGMNVGQKISTGLGAWTMITTSVALFFASLLAVKLGLTGVNFLGATLGLVIWAAFFIVMTYLEISAVSSLIGGMVSTVKHSLSSVFSTFSQSSESKAKEIARTNAKAQSREMRQQLEKLFSTHDIDKKIDEYVQKLEPQRIDIKNLKKQIKDLLTHIQVTEKADYDYPNTVKKMILEEADKSTLSKEDKQAIKDHVSSLKDIASGDASNQEKAKQGIEELTPADRQQIDQYQDKIKNALRNTNKEELQPEKLEADLRKIFNEPGQASNVIKEKASAIDRPTLVKLLSSQNMSEQEADKYISKVEMVLQKVGSTFSGAGSKASTEKEGVKAKIKGMFSGAGSSTSLGQVYSDFTSLFQSSAAGPDLKYKLEHYNKEEMTVLITNRTSMSRSEAEPIAEKIVSARDGVLEKAHQVETKVNEKMEEAKRMSLKAAEESRKAAVTAAWWLVGTAILSAAASAVGGMLALEGIF